MTVRTRTADVLPDAEADRHILPVEESGLGALGTERGNLPLESIDVRSVVTGLAVRTELAQGFRNTFGEPLEATYIFPLPDRAAVTALRMEADDRVVEGILKERGEARAEYDQAISEGKRASIAEEDRPGVFTLRVGNIMPGERVVIRTTLAGRLPFEDGEATYRFPLVVAPRYIPGTALPGDQVGTGVARDTDAVPDASRISPPVLLPGFPNPVRLGIRVEVDPAGLGLRALRSSLHGVSIAESDEAGGPAVVTLQDPGERANRDFILRLRLGAAEAVATSLAVRADGDAAEGTEETAEAEGTFVLTLLPPAPTPTADDEPEGTDVVLVLDRSGSMDGWKMVAARRAAARVVDTLTSRDRFAALTFDDMVETPPNLPAGLVEATDRHRFRAVEHLAKVEARGGTELAEPLRQAAALLARAGDDSRAKALVLVTDGQVGDEDQILADLGPALTGIRVHTVGVDQAVNEAFLRRLAQNSGGRCELVESEDRLDDAMAAIHRRIAGPVLTGLRVTAAGLDIDPASIEPARLPDLFPGAPLVISGRFRGKAAGAVTLTAEAAGEPWSQTIEATPAADNDLGAFWARGRVRDLEDRYVVAQHFSADRPALEREILGTSLRFGVLCRFTAFVAVDSRVVNRQGDPRKVTNPVDAPAGWGMFADEASAPESMDWMAVESSRGLPTLAASPMPAPPMAAPAAPAGAPMMSAPAPAARMRKRASGGFGAAVFGGGAPGGAPAPAEMQKSAFDAVEELTAMPPKVGGAPVADAGPGRTHRHADWASLVTELLERLTADAGRSAGTRVGILAALAVADLPTLLQLLRDEGAAEEDIRAVAELSGALADVSPESDTAEVDRAWELTVSVLSRLARRPAAPAPRRTRAFWKR